MKAVPFNVKYGVYGIISSEDASTGVPTYADIVEFDPLMNVKWTPNTNSGVLYGEGIPRKSVVKKGSDDLELGVAGQVALEQQMACGIGMCHCCVRLFRGANGIEPRRVCHDGPVFDVCELRSW